MALRAVKGNEKANELLFDLTRDCGESPVTTNTVLHRVCPRLEAMTPLDRGGISGDLTDISSTNGALRAVKGTEEGNE